MRTIIISPSCVTYIGGLVVALVGSFEGIRSVVITRTLGDVQLLDFHGDGDGAPERINISAELRIKRQF